MSSDNRRNSPPVCDSFNSRRGPKIEELRKLEYFDLFNRVESNKLSSFVPDPISASSSHTLYNKNKTYENKLGIYKTCNGQTHIVQQCPRKSLGVHSLNFSNDGEILILGYHSGGIQGIKTSDGSLYKKFLPCSLTSTPVTCIRFNPNPTYSDIFFASSTSGRIVKLSLADDDPIEDIIKQKENEIISIDVNKTGKTLLTGGKDAVVRLYDIETCKLTTSYSRKSYNDDPEERQAGFHVMRLCVVRYHPDDENVFITGGWDSLVKIWDVRTPTGCVETIIGPHISGETVDVKKTTLLTGSFTPKEGLQLWDLRTAKLIKSCNPENASIVFKGQFIYVAQFFHGDPLGDIILSANIGLKTLDVISIKLNTVIYTFHCSEQVLAAQSRNTLIAYGDAGEQVYVSTFNMAGVINSSPNR